jgi:hypothetical protein
MGNALKLLPELAPGSAELARNFSKFPIKFPVLREFEGSRPIVGQTTRNNSNFGNTVSSDASGTRLRHGAMPAARDRRAFADHDLSEPFATSIA